MDNNGDLEVIKVISEEEYARLAEADEEAVVQSIRDLPPDAAPRSLQEVREAVWAERLCIDADDPANA